VYRRIVTAGIYGDLTLRTDSFATAFARGGSVR